MELHNDISRGAQLMLCATALFASMSAMIKAMA